MWGNTDPSPLGIGELIEENITVLLQLSELVGGLSPEQYQQRFGLQGQHTTGKHVRHIIDHYETFLFRRHENPAARLNYEQRRREASLERGPHIACRRLMKLCQALEKLTDGSDQSPVLMDYPTGTASVEMNSSVERELVFLSSHTIHHMAIIGLLAESLGMQPARDFGVHPSTLRHWQRI